MAATRIMVSSQSRGIDRERIPSRPAPVVGSLIHSAGGAGALDHLERLAGHFLPGIFFWSSVMRATALVKVSLRMAVVFDHHGLAVVGERRRGPRSSGLLLVGRSGR